MKFAARVLCAAGCLVMCSLASAQNVPKPGQPAGKAPQQQFGQPFNNGEAAANAAAMRAELMKRFDLDGDGKLSQQEQLAGTRAMQQRGVRVPGAPNLVRPGNNGPVSGPGVVLPQQSQPAKKPTRREEILMKRFDKDGDGKLNDEEKAAARAELGQKNKADKK